MSGNREHHDSAAKRFKKDEDNLWGDELDESSLEECFFLASQVLSESEHPQPSTSETQPGPSKQQPDPSKSSPVVFKKPTVPPSFRPKKPSLITSSSAFTQKVPHAGKFPRKVPATSSQSETFPKQTRGTPTQLQVYPKKSSAAGTSRPISPVSRSTMQTPHTRPMESSISKQSPSVMEQSSSRQKPEEPGPSLGSSASLGQEEMFPRRIIAEEKMSLPGTSRDTNVGGEFQFAVKSTPRPAVIPRTGGALLDTSMLTSRSTASPGPQELIAELSQVKLTNEKLQDDLLSKDGEVTILRSQISNLKLELDKQRLAKIQEMQDQATQFQEKMKKLEKELQQKKTLLEFKNLEVGNAEERCRLLESQTKLKFIDPQSAQVAGNFPDNPVPSTSAAEKQEEKQGDGNKDKPTPYVKMFDRLVQSMTDTDWFSGDGYKLGVRISPYIFEGTLYKADREDIPNVPYLYSQIHGGTLTPHGPTVRVFYTYLSRLFKCFTFDCLYAKIVIQMLVWRCFEILKKELKWLEWHKKKFCYDELHKLDYDVCAQAGKVYKTTRSYLSAKKWYSCEQGIEVRRTLGLLAELARINKDAAQYLAGEVSILPNIPGYRKYRRLIRRKRRLAELRRRKKRPKINLKERQRMAEEKKREAEWRAKKDKEEEAAMKKAHEKAMDDELEALGLKLEDWVDVDPDADKGKRLSPLPHIRNYVIRCRKMNLLSHIEPPVNLSWRPGEKERREKERQEEERRRKRDNAGDKGQSSKVVALPKEVPKIQPPSEKIYLMHPMKWNLKTVKDRQRELGCKFEKVEIEWTPFKETLDKWAKDILPSPREKMRRWTEWRKKLRKMFPPKRKKGGPMFPFLRRNISYEEIKERLQELRDIEKMPPPKKVRESRIKYDFLEHLYSMLEIICDWRFTVTCNGILYVMVLLLVNIVSKTKLTEDRFPVMIKLIKDLILCRPSISVLTQLINLLGWLASIKPIQESLCTGTGPAPYLTCRQDIVTFIKGVPHYGVRSEEDVFFYSRSSCMITLLAWLIALRRADPMSYATLGIHIIKWLRSTVKGCQPNGPNWLGPTKGKDLRDCQCRPRIIQAVIMLMHTCYEHLVITRFKDESITFKEICDFLGLCMIFFRELVEQKHSDIGLLMSNAEGEYQFVIHGLKLNIDLVLLTENEKNSLRILLDIEAQHSAMIPRIEVSEKCMQDLSTLLSYTSKIAYLDCYYKSESDEDEC